MNLNPYEASPLQPGIQDYQELDAGECISDLDFRQYRKAVILIALTTAMFLALAAASMLMDAMYVDAAIAAVAPAAILLGLCQFVKAKDAAAAQVSTRRYRIVCSSLRPLCFMLGPVMFAVGVMQLIWVPTMWQLFPWSFLVCGPAAFCIGFVWPVVRNEPRIRCP